MTCMSLILSQLLEAVARLSAAVGEEEAVAVPLDRVRDHLRAHVERAGSSPTDLQACEAELRQVKGV